MILLSDDDNHSALMTDPSSPCTDTEDAFPPSGVVDESSSGTSDQSGLFGQMKRGFVEGVVA